MDSAPLKCAGAVTVQPVPPQELRRALSRFAIGVAVLGARHGRGDPVGITANSFNSLSLDPPLILFSIGSGSSRLAAFETADIYSVNLLAAEQRWLSKHFTRRFPGWKAVDWHQDPSGAPVLAGCTATFICRPWSQQPAGDHVLFVAEVINVVTSEPAVEPLIYYASAYRTLASPSQ